MPRVVSAVQLRSALACSPTRWPVAASYCHAPCLPGRPKALGALGALHRTLTPPSPPPPPPPPLPWPPPPPPPLLLRPPPLHLRPLRTLRT